MNQNVGKGVFFLFFRKCVIDFDTDLVTDDPIADGFVLWLQRHKF
jgi:hypothetical protein